MSEQVERERIEWVKVAAGALAAVVTAVLLSTLGAAGTIIGAALGSVIATVANAMFSRGISAGHQGLTAAQAAALAAARRRTTRAGSDPDGLADTSVLPAQEAPRPPWRDRLARLSWKRLAAAAAGLFVVVMLVITGFELVSGRAVSTYTGGSSDSTRSSLPGLGGGSGSSSRTPSPSASPSDGVGTPSPSATEESGAPAPSPSASSSATAGESPSATASDSAGATDPASPSATASETATAPPDADATP